MVTVEKIIAELKIGGYLDAAEYIERQFATITISMWTRRGMTQT